MEGIEDQGAAMMSALASVLDVGGNGVDEAEIERRLEEAIDSIADPAGTFYRFSMSHSLLRRARVAGKEEVEVS